MGDSQRDELVCYLADKRSRAKRLAEGLLWENIHESIYWRASTNVNDKDFSDRKMRIQEAHWHQIFVELLTSFSQTLNLIEPDDVGEILQYGGARRLFSIYRSLRAVSKTAYWGREKVLTSEEKGLLDDSLMLFYVHVMGFFDALAIAFCRRFLILDEFDERRADLLSREFRGRIDSSALDDLIEANDEWFARIKDGYRNRYVHRIPPYVAPAVYTSEDAEEFSRLEAEKWSALRQRRIEAVDELEKQQDRLGKFHPFFSFTETDGNVPILPTVLDDALRFQVVAISVIEVLLPRLELREQP